MPDLGLPSERRDLPPPLLKMEELSCRAGVRGRA